MKKLLFLFVFVLFVACNSQERKAKKILEQLKYNTAMLKMYEYKHFVASHNIKFEGSIDDGTFRTIGQERAFSLLDSTNYYQKIVDSLTLEYSKVKGTVETLPKQEE